MSEFNKEYRIAQLLAQKMTGELSPEEEAELHEEKKILFRQLSLTIEFKILRLNVKEINL